MPPPPATPDAPPDPGICVTRHDESPVRVSVEVEVDAARVAEAADRAYDALARSIQLPGFRRGRVPRSVLERRFGASIAEELEHTLVAETLAGALEKAEVEPVIEPTISAEAPAAGKPFRYTARVEVRPAIELPELSGLRGRRPAVEVTDAEVEEELESLRQRSAPILEEPEGTPLAEGHIAALDFVGRVDGRPFAGGTGRGVDVEIGGGRFLPGFEEQLVGARAGDDLEVRVRFPEDYGNAELAGREAEFAVHVAAVKRREVRALDDEFAKDMGEFATLDELRDRIRGELFASRQQHAEGIFQRSLVDALLERTCFDAPPGLVEQELEQELRAAHRRLEGRMPEEALHRQLTRWKEEWRGEAERAVRERLLLEAVVAAQGIAVDDEETESRIASLAEQHATNPARLRDALGDDALRQSVRAALAREKALARLASEAKVEESSDS